MALRHGTALAAPRPRLADGSPTLSASATAAATGRASSSSSSSSRDYRRSSSYTRSCACACSSGFRAPDLLRLAVWAVRSHRVGHRVHAVGKRKAAHAARLLHQAALGAGHTRRAPEQAAEVIGAKEVAT